jgi:hypothetical protein
MADAPDEAQQMAQAYVDVAQQALTHASGYLADPGYQPGEDATGPSYDDDAQDDGDARGMDRFAARSAQRRGGFAPGSVNAATHAALRGRR